MEEMGLSHTKANNNPSDLNTIRKPLTPRAFSSKCFAWPEGGEADRMEGLHTSLFFFLFPSCHLAREAWAR